MYWRRQPSSRPSVTYAGLLCAAFACGLLGAGCGGPGSGSSGLSERAAIGQALESRECAEATNAVMYCPTDEQDLSGAAESIATPVVDEVEVECFLFDEIDVLCLFSLSFQPNGFESDASFVMATRPFDSDEPWRVGPPTEFFTVKEDGESVPVAFGEAFFEAPDLEPSSVQLAIVEISQAGDEPPPEEVASLDVLGTTLAFVTPEFESVLTIIPPENEVIDLALDQKTCVDGGIAFICPVDTVFQGAQFEPQFGVPLFFFETFVNLDLANQQPLECVPTDSRRCGFEIELHLKGTIEIFYQSAARVIDPDTGDGPQPRNWRIGEEIFDPSEEAEDERVLILPIEIDTRDLEAFPEAPEGGRLVPVQLAVMPDPFPITNLRFVETLDPWIGFYAFVAEPVIVRVETR